jgi:hypothetical protein
VRNVLCRCTHVAPKILSVLIATSARCALGLAMLVGPLLADAIAACTTGQCAITFNTDQFLHSNWTACGNLKGNLGTALPPGASQVLDHASNTLVPCTPQLCPYAIPSTRDNSVLVNVVPMAGQVILAYLPSLSLVLDASAAIGAFAAHNALLYQAYIEAYSEAMQLQPESSAAPCPGVTDKDIAVAVQAAANQRTAIAKASIKFNPRPFLRLGYDLNDTVGFLQIYAEILAFKNNYKGATVPGAAYFRWGYSKCV